MHTRTTSDYTPTLKGSRDENAAFNARREMMKTFSTSSAATRRVKRPGHKAMTEATDDLIAPELPHTPISVDS